MKALLRYHIKTAIKRFLEPFGFTIQRGQTGRTTLDGFLKHVRRLGFVPGTVIDVGVAYGTSALYESFPNTYHLLIEPLAEFREVLDHICGKYRADYVIAAAGAMPGSTVINVHTDLMGSSLLKESQGRYRDGIPREVTIVTIDDLCLERQLIGPFVIKVDVQGAELCVLDGASRTLRQTELVILEVSLFQFYEEGPLFHEVVSYMAEQGFVVYEIFGQNLRPLDSSLAQVDLAFVKKDGYFRQSHSYDMNTAGSPRR